MTPTTQISAADFAAENFTIHTLDDEIRADALCGRLLQLWVQELTTVDKLPPEEAGLLAWGADYFLRDFVIGDRRENIFSIDPLRVRQFAGHWYIINNLEPNRAELSDQLRGIDAFYRYARQGGRVSAETATEISRQCADLDYYRQRIDDFWQLEGDGYRQWRAECPLP